MGFNGSSLFLKVEIIPNIYQTLTKFQALTHTSSFNPHNNPQKYVSLLPPLCRWENWGTEQKTSKLPLVLQPVREGAVMRRLTFCPQRLWPLPNSTPKFLLHRCPCTLQSCLLTMQCLKVRHCAQRGTCSWASSIKDKKINEWDISYMCSLGLALWHIHSCTGAQWGRGSCLLCTVNPVFE